MRILYVTRLWLGLADLIVRGRSEAGGMPAFLRPLRGLLAAGHQVEAIVGADPGTTLGEVRAPWLQGAGFDQVRWQFSGWERPLPAIRLLSAVRAALRRRRYDFFYGHGSVGSLGCRRPGRGLLGARLRAGSYYLPPVLRGGAGTPTGPR